MTGSAEKLNLTGRPKGIEDSGRKLQMSAAQRDLKHYFQSFETLPGNQFGWIVRLILIIKVLKKNHNLPNHHKFL